jgi:IS30 family transposase
MGDVSKRHHKKLTTGGRDQITLMRGRGDSTRSIAVSLGCSPGTISEELMRNGLPNGDYIAIHAQAQTEARKIKAHKRRSPRREEVYVYVVEKLREGWSPE